MNKKVASPVQKTEIKTALGNRCADHMAPLYPQKLALTSPTGGGRSVGIVPSRTKATEIYYYGLQSVSLKYSEQELEVLQFPKGRVMIGTLVKARNKLCVIVMGSTHVGYALLRGLTY